MQKRDGWRNPKHSREWLSSLSRFAFPRIGNVPVSEVTSADVLEILTPLWHRKAETAKPVRQRLRAVLEWAVAMEYRLDNPCDRIGPVLGPQQDVTEHMQAVPHREAATWTVPPERMKHRREHRVPLSERAREVLAEARRIESSSDLVFPSPAGGLLPDRDLSTLLRELGIGAVPHGFRSSFRDWAAEETDAPHAVMEAALSHVIRNQVEAAYARSDLFERRRVLMDQWAEFLAASRKQAAA